LKFPYPKFLKHLRNEKHLKEVTVEKYKRWVTHWTVWCNAQGIKPLKAEIEDAGEYVNSLKNDYHPDTVGHIMSRLKNFYDWACYNGMAKRNPFSFIRRPRAHNRIPQVLSEKSILRILNSFKGRKPKELRDRAMLEVLYATGCRSSELCAMNVHDIDFEGKKVIIHDIKNKKDRIGFLTDRAVEALKEYLKYSRPFFEDIDSPPALFLARHGQRIHRNILYEAIQKAARKAKVSTSVYPHLVRHSFATHLLENGADIRYVQELLGHQKLTSTQIYTHVASRKLKEAYNRFHPCGKEVACTRE